MSKEVSVTVRLPAELVEELDAAVEESREATRSSLIREWVREQVSECGFVQGCGKTDPFERYIEHMGWDDRESAVEVRDSLCTAHRICQSEFGQYGRRVDQRVVLEVTRMLLDARRHKRVARPSRRRDEGEE